MLSMKLVLLWLAWLATARAERSFFVFDNGVVDVESVEDQAVLLKELGYDGICIRPAKASGELLAAFDKHGVAIMATYVILPVNIGEATLPQDVVDHIRMLKGRKTLVWLALTNINSTDVAAVGVIRNVCDLAKENGLDVVLYPHVSFRTGTVAECEHLRKLADRLNLGISFNLCHFLCQNDPATVEAAISSVAPHLKLVQISGANEMPPGKPDWNELIKPLGEGDFDMARVLRTLDETGYQGPVNLQCYKIPGPAARHLKISMDAWKKLNESSRNPEQSSRPD